MVLTLQKLASYPLSVSKHDFFTPRSVRPAPSKHSPSTIFSSLHFLLRPQLLEGSRKLQTHNVFFSWDHTWIERESVHTVPYRLIVMCFLRGQVGISHRGRLMTEYGPNGSS